MVYAKDYPHSNLRQHALRIINGMQKNGRSEAEIKQLIDEINPLLRKVIVI